MAVVDGKSVPWSLHQILPHHNWQIIDNRGSAGTEAQDYGYKFHQSHRHSNSSANAELVDFKTKFEFNDEPVFEESIHGPREEDDDTAESNSAVSLDEETESKQAWNFSVQLYKLRIRDFFDILLLVGSAV